MDHTSRLVDKQPLSGTTTGTGVTNGGYGFTTSWVDLHAFDLYSMTAVFTGLSPQGTLTLQQSNAREFTGGNSVQPEFVGNSSAVNDTANVPAGYGQNLVTVAGAGAYVLNQTLVPYRWVRLVFVPTSNVVTQYDVMFHGKTGG